MSDTHDLHGHAAATPPGTSLFPAAEWETLRQQDRYAARVIVLLMLSIFTMGVIGYALVDIWVS